MANVPPFGPLKEYNFRDLVNPVFECVIRVSAKAGVSYRYPFEQGKFGFNGGFVNVVRNRHIVEARIALVQSAFILTGMNKTQYLNTVIGKPTWSDDVTPAELTLIPERNVWYDEINRACAFLDTGAGSGGILQVLLPFGTPQCFNFGAGFLNIRNKSVSNLAAIANRFSMQVEITNGDQQKELRKVIFPSLSITSRLGNDVGMDCPGPFTIPGPSSFFKTNFVFQTLMQSVVINGIQYDFIPTIAGAPGIATFTYTKGMTVKLKSTGALVPAPAIAPRGGGANLATFVFSVGVRPLAEVQLTPTSFNGNPRYITDFVVSDPNAVHEGALVTNFTTTGSLNLPSDPVTAPPTGVSAASSSIRPESLAVDCLTSVIIPPPPNGGVIITYISKPAFILKCAEISANFTVYVQNLNSFPVSFTNLNVAFDSQGLTKLTPTSPFKYGSLGPTGYRVDTAPVSGLVAANSVGYFNFAVTYNFRKMVTVNGQPAEITENIPLSAEYTKVTASLQLTPSGATVTGPLGVNPPAKIKLDDPTCAVTPPGGATGDAANTLGGVFLVLSANSNDSSSTTSTFTSLLRVPFAQRNSLTSSDLVIGGRVFNNLSSSITGRITQWIYSGPVQFMSPPPAPGGSNAVVPSSGGGGTGTTVWPVNAFNDIVFFQFYSTTDFVGGPPYPPGTYFLTAIFSYSFAGQPQVASATISFQVF